jgi:hypothetical protein
MNKRERKKAFDEIEAKMSVQSRQSDLSRARSITAGTCSGGTTEVVMRGGDGFLWIILQPVEVTELIHQLAANIGCHINIQPRVDFASWRNWNYTSQELEHYRLGGGGLPAHMNGAGHAPHVNDMTSRMQIGANMPHPDLQPGMSNTLKENEDAEEAMAVEKLSDGRSPEGTSSGLANLEDKLATLHESGD